MDAVKFIEERIRMCKTYFGCSECPACDNGSCRFSVTLGDRPDKQIEIVAEWAAAHPRKTRQDLFLEQWPDAQLSRAGDIIICPKQLCKGEELNELMAGCRGTNCDVCRREFYGKAVE